MYPLLALYLAAINAATFAVFALDKRAARARGRRVAEARLLMLAAVGGSPAAIAAQQILRHKTQKEPFRTLLWMIVATQAVALIAVAYRLVR